MKHAILFDLDRPTFPKDIGTPLLPKGLKGKPTLEVKAETRTDLKKLMTEAPLSPEASGVERARIQSLLERLDFDDRIRDMINAIIEKKYVPREIIEAGQKALKVEEPLMMEIFQSYSRLTQGDRENIMLSLIGGKDKIPLLMSALPSTIIETPSANGIKKVSGMVLFEMLPQIIQQSLHY